MHTVAHVLPYGCAVFFLLDHRDGQRDQFAADDRGDRHGSGSGALHAQDDCVPESACELDQRGIGGDGHQ